MSVHDLISDELWASGEPLLPSHPAQPKGGNRWLPDRPALCGIIYVLQTGMRWNDLPLERGSGSGSGSTCWRRLGDWQAAGVWQRLHRVLLDELGEAGRSAGRARAWTAPASGQNGGPGGRPSPP